MKLRFLIVLLVCVAGCRTTSVKRDRSAVPQKANVGLPASDAPAPERMRVHVIDVGQGSATLVEFPCAAVLIDTGGEGTRTFDGGDAAVAYLEKFFARRTDLNRTLATVFITHPHIDHTRGLGKVMNTFTVSHLVTNGLPKGPGGAVWESGGEEQANAEWAAKKNGGLRTVSRDEIVASKGVTDEHIDAVKCETVDPAISVLWGGMKGNLEGWEHKAFSNANNHSLVVKIDVDKHPLLITGDLETPAIKSLIQFHGKALDVDVMLVGHHGSYNGTSDKLMQTLTPCMAVVSMGDSHREEEWTAWQYGHPRRDAVETVVDGLQCSRAPKTVLVAIKPRRFEEKTIDAALYGTGWEGTVVLELSQHGTWKAYTER